MMQYKGIITRNYESQISSLYFQKTYNENKFKRISNDLLSIKYVLRMFKKGKKKEI